MFLQPLPPPHPTEHWFMWKNVSQPQTVQPNHRASGSGQSRSVTRGLEVKGKWGRADEIIVVYEVVGSGDMGKFGRSGRKLLLMVIPKGNNDGRRKYNTAYFTKYGVLRTENRCQCTEADTKSS